MEPQTLDYQSLIPSFSAVGDLSNPAGLTSAVVLALLFVFLGGIGYAAFQFRQARLRVQNLQRLLSPIDRENLAAERRAIRQEASNLPGCEHVWREFDESLVLVEKSNRLFNTIDAAHFFNNYTLARELTENRLLAAMPGILTAFGVIGTFAGLQLGLSSLSNVTLGEDQINELTNGIFGMIAGASVAFTTSLWGVFLSVSFNFFEKVLERLIRSDIANFQNKVDFLYARITAEQSLANIEESSAVSKDKLAELDEKIGNRLQEAMMTATESMREGITESLNQVLGPAIAKLVENAHSGSEKALESLMTEFMSKMGNAGEEQRQALTDTTGAMINASAHITAGVDELIQKLDATLNSNADVATSFRAIAEANGTTVLELGRVSDKLSASSIALENQSTNFENASTKLETAVSSAAQLLNDASTALERQAAAHSVSIERLESIYASITALESHLKDVDAKAGDNISEAGEQIRLIAEVMKVQMTAFESRISLFSESQSDALKNTTKEMSEASAGVTARVEVLLEGVNKALNTSLDSMDSFKQVANANSVAATQLKNVADTMSGSANALAQQEAAIATATSALNTTTAEAGERILEAARAMSEVSKNQSNALSTVAQLSNQIERIGEQLISAGEKADQGLDKVNTHFERVSAAMNKHIQELETQLSNLLNEYSKEVQTQTSDRLNAWNSQTNEYISAMSDAVSALASVVDEIETKVAR